MTAQKRILSRVRRRVNVEKQQLENMKLAELREAAKEAGIKNIAKLKKSMLLTLKRIKKRS